MFDVAIVGGGPAGATTALHLVRRERIPAKRIVVLDKARFPRDKPCAGAISEFGLEALGAIGLTIDVPHVVMDGVRVLLREGAGETRARLGICVRRTEFDAALLDAVRAEGVEVADGDGLTALARTGDSFRLTTTSGRTIDARLVAACDGAGSTTRKLLGLKEADRKGHLYVTDTLVAPVDAGASRGLCDFDLRVLEDGLAGYYWDFPTVQGGARQVSRGIYDANLDSSGARSGRTKDVLARSLRQRGIDIASVKLRPFSTRPFVAGSKTWLRGVVLVGEACGIDQTTGEGIAQAIEMGRLAARHLAIAVATRDVYFAGYDRELRASTMGRHLLQSAWLARMVYGPRGRPFQRYLLESDYARTAALRWYRGESLPKTTLARLGVGLATSFLRTAASSPSAGASVR